MEKVDTNHLWRIFDKRMANWLDCETICEREETIMYAVRTLGNIVKELHHMPDEPDVPHETSPPVTPESEIPDVSDREFIFRGRRYMIPIGSTATDYLICIGDRTWQENE